MVQTWDPLYYTAPELVPVIIQTIIDVEKVVVGIKRGERRKQRVMSIMGNVLDTKQYFVTLSPAEQLRFLNLVSIFVDIVVSTFNYCGLFAWPDRPEASRG